MKVEDIGSEIAEIKTDIKWIKEKLGNMCCNIDERFDDFNDKLLEIDERIKSLESSRDKLYGIMIVLAAFLSAIGSKLAGVW